MRHPALVDLVISASFNPLSIRCLGTRSGRDLHYLHLHCTTFYDHNWTGQIGRRHLARQCGNKIVDGKRQAADRRHGNLTVHDCMLHYNARYAWAGDIEKYTTYAVVITTHVHYLLGFAVPLAQRLLDLLRTKQHRSA